MRYAPMIEDNRVNYAQSMPGGSVRSEGKSLTGDNTKITAASEIMRENLSKLNYAWQMALEVARRDGRLNNSQQNPYSESSAGSQPRIAGGYVSGLLPPVLLNPSPHGAIETEVEAQILSSLSKECQETYKRLQKSLKSLPNYIPKLKGDKTQDWYNYLRELDKALIPDDVWTTVTNGSVFWIYPSTPEQARDIGQSPTFAGLPKQPNNLRTPIVRIQELEDQLRYRYAYNMFTLGTKGVISIEGIIKQVPAPNVTVILHRVNSSFEMSAFNAIDMANNELDQFHMKRNEDIRNYTNRLQTILCELSAEVLIPRVLNQLNGVSIINQRLTILVIVEIRESRQENKRNLSEQLLLARSKRRLMK